MLYNESLGDTGETMVFLHGIAGSTRYWKSRVKPLSAQYRLLLVDLLGYGKSAKPWTKYTVERHVEELYQVVRRQKPFTLVGHSKSHHSRNDRMYASLPEGAPLVMDI